MVQTGATHFLKSSKARSSEACFRAEKEGLGRFQAVESNDINQRAPKDQPGILSKHPCHQTSLGFTSAALLSYHKPMARCKGALLKTPFGSPW